MIKGDQRSFHAELDLLVSVFLGQNWIFEYMQIDVKLNTFLKCNDFLLLLIKNFQSLVMGAI